MDLQKLRRMVIKSRKDGFTDHEIRTAMSQDGVPEETIRQVFHSLQKKQSQAQQRTRNKNRKQDQRGKTGNKQRQREQKPQKNIQSSQQVTDQTGLMDDSGLLEENRYKLKQKLLSLTNSYNL